MSNHDLKSIAIAIEKHIEKLSTSRLKKAAKDILNEPDWDYCLDEQNFSNETQELLTGIKDLCDQLKKDYTSLVVKHGTDVYTGEGSEPVNTLYCRNLIEQETNYLESHGFGGVSEQCINTIFERRHSNIRLENGSLFWGNDYIVAVVFNKDKLEKILNMLPLDYIGRAVQRHRSRYNKM